MSTISASSSFYERVGRTASYLSGHEYTKMISEIAGKVFKDFAIVFTLSAFACTFSVSSLATYELLYSVSWQFAFSALFTICFVASREIFKDIKKSSAVFPWLSYIPPSMHGWIIWIFKELRKGSLILIDRMTRGATSLKIAQHLLGFLFLENSSDIFSRSTQRLKSISLSTVHLTKLGKWLGPYSCLFLLSSLTLSFVMLSGIVTAKLIRDHFKEDGYIAELAAYIGTYSAIEITLYLLLGNTVPFIKMPQTSILKHLTLLTQVLYLPRIFLIINIVALQILLSKRFCL